MKLGFISNITADTARSAQNSTNKAISASATRLSSGNRLNAASDDVASLAISTNMRTKITSLRSALNNVNQASSMLQIADQSLGKITELLQRQKSLAVSANSGAISNTERSFLSQEFRQLTAEIERLATTTNFNNIRFFDAERYSALTLAQTNASAFNSILNTTSLQVSGGGNAVRSNTPIQAFNRVTGASMAGIAAVGRLQLVEANGTPLADGAFAQVNDSVYGSFSKFEFSDVTYGVIGRGSATLTATLNGVEYTGRVVSNAAARVILSNGNTRLNLHVGSVNLTNAAQANFTQASIGERFNNTVITRTSNISGVNFFDTRLNGAIGTVAQGTANIRLTTDDTINIGKFEYVRNTGTANTNQISVQINGRPFTALNVRDLISGGTIQFRGESSVEVLSISLVGLDTNIVNIRTREYDRDQFINALNKGFSSVRSAIDITTDSANISVELKKATPDALYDGQQIDVTTPETAQVANNVLDMALRRAVAIRANVGAATARMNYASDVISSSLQSQSIARATLADTNIASESSAFTQAITKAEFANYAIAQANNLPETLLDLLNN